MTRMSRQSKLSHLGHRGKDFPQNLAKSWPIVWIFSQMRSSRAHWWKKLLRLCKNSRPKEGSRSKYPQMATWIAKTWHGAKKQTQMHTQLTYIVSSSISRCCKRRNSRGSCQIYFIKQRRKVLKVVQLRRPRHKHPHARKLSHPTQKCSTRQAVVASWPVRNQYRKATRRMLASNWNSEQLK